MNNNVLHTIRQQMPQFSKGQKRIAAYILEHYDKAAFMTASRLGQTVEVSESTVVRFAAQLGYEGYPEMQRDLRELIRGKLTSIQRIQVSNDQMQGDLLTSVMQRDMDSLRTAIEQVDRGQFEQMVDKLAEGTAHLPAGDALVIVSDGVSELLFPPDLQKCDTGAERRGRGDLRAAGAGAAR
ncbi:MAG: MurR/RpiR family transcriptional regulator [Dysosmobacter sp.]